MTSHFSRDIENAKAALATLPRDWDGKTCVLELKDAGFNWRQVEWWAFYFEYLCNSRLKTTFEIPGEMIGSTRFDLKGSVNWDLKAKAIKSDDHRCILNDKTALDESIKTYGEHGFMIALCDVEYNDEDRTFQKWRTELQGGPSDYTKKRIARTSTSRYRKTRAILNEILFFCLDAAALESLGEMRQGRNSNGKPRPLKYELNLENVDTILVDRLDFST